jgi:hypothetical protein
MPIRLKKNLLTIGSKDMVDMPDINVFDLPCKIDTGAQSSSIHCERIKLKEIDGKEVLIVRFLDKTIPQYKRKDYQFENFTEKKIRNSFGDTEYRYLIPLKVVLFGQTFITEFSLADRALMRYQVLLGKKLLFKQFLVDVSLRNLSYNKKKNAAK